MEALELYMSSWSFGPIVLRMALACVVGAVIGMNREIHSKGAGVKTHVLVCLGSALAMMVSQYVYMRFPDATADLNRMGAGVVSGVGFLGVGTIIVTGRNEVRGLTTAAGLWACACIGLAVGIGAVVVSVVALLFVLFTFIVLSRLDAAIRKGSNAFDMEVSLVSPRNMEHLTEALEDVDVSLTGFRVAPASEDPEGFVVVLSVLLPRGADKVEFLKDVNALRYVRFCAEM